MTGCSTYDTRNRLTAIAHKDGTTVLDGYTYTLSDGGNILRTDQADGSYWEYEYDDRDRLTEAVRSHPGGNIRATYAYTYDAGDNMVSKTEPYLDDFNDGTYSGWTVASGSWDASAGYLKNTVRTGSAVTIPSTDASKEVRLRYLREEYSNPAQAANVYFRFNNTGYNYICVSFEATQIRLMQYSGGVYTTLDTNTSAATANNTWYNVRIVADGTDIKVYRNVDGALEEQVLSTTATTITNSQVLRIGMTSSCTYRFDDIRILADDLSNTTTFAVNNANELTSMTDPNGTTTFAYDAWGRMTGKARGSYAATYGYRYGDKLQSVASNFAGEGSVVFGYSGDGKRRSRTVGSTATWYNWLGNSVINEQDSSGTLSRTYFGHTDAHVDGPSPATGDYVYYFHDQLGSIQRVCTADKSTYAEFEYEPYGRSYTSSGSTSPVTRRYADLEWENTAQNYFARFRYLSLADARWISRDPLDMIVGPNIYAYVRCNPIIRNDALGLWGSQGGKRPGHPRPEYEEFDEVAPPAFPAFTWMHFQSLKNSNGCMEKAIEKCSIHKFSCCAHKGQDWFSHYDKGYRWYTGGHAVDSLNGNDPDDPWVQNEEGEWEYSEAYKKMLRWTASWEKAWERRCKTPFPLGDPGDFDLPPHQG